MPLLADLVETPSLGWRKAIEDEACLRLPAWRRFSQLHGPQIDVFMLVSIVLVDIWRVLLLGFFWFLNRGASDPRLEGFYLQLRQELEENYRMLVSAGLKVNMAMADM